MEFPCPGEFMMKSWPKSQLLTAQQIQLPQIPTIHPTSCLSPLSYHVLFWGREPPLCHLHPCLIFLKKVAALRSNPKDISPEEEHHLLDEAQWPSLSSSLAKPTQTVSKSSPAPFRPSLKTKKSALRYKAAWRCGLQDKAGGSLELVLSAVFLTMVVQTPCLSDDLPPCQPDHIGTKNISALVTRHLKLCGELRMYCKPSSGWLGRELRSKILPGLP